jgi:hypothetical protein
MVKRNGVQTPKLGRGRGGKKKKGQRELLPTYMGTHVGRYLPLAQLFSGLKTEESLY